MKENFFICIQAVLPMFLLLAIGYTVRCIGLVNDKELSKMNSLTFKILFPFLMFNNIYGSEISESVDIKLALFGVISIGIEYLLVTLFVLKIEKTPASRGAMIQAMFRSNFVIMGLPIAINIFGKGNVGTTAIMVAIVVPLYNILAITTLEIYRKGTIHLKDILLRIVKNPLIIGAVFGIFFVVLGIHLPVVLETPIDNLSDAASPVALLILGASFQFSSVRGKLRNTLLSITARLAVVPGCVLTIAMLIGIHGISFVTLVGIFAAPCAISSYTMAREMQSDYKLAGNTVVFSSAFCCFTMFLWLFLFKNLGVF